MRQTFNDFVDLVLVQGLPHYCLLGEAHIAEELRHDVSFLIELGLDHEREHDEPHCNVYYRNVLQLHFVTILNVSARSLYVTAWSDTCSTGKFAMM